MWRSLAIGCLLLVPAFSQTALPGTGLLGASSDPAARMVEGIHAYLDREAGEAAKQRAAMPTGDVEAKRARLRRILGVVDARVPFSNLSRSEIGKGAGYRVYAVHWPVFDGVDGEGLLLNPDSAPRARVIAIPDAGQSPETLFHDWAHRLATNRVQVLIPVIIDRGHAWSGIPGVKMTTQTHREWIYRMAFEVGRTLPGYEVQKVLAAVDWFARQDPAPIAVSGNGDGGMIALFAAALDTRIRAAQVNGYYREDRAIWNEPIDHDLWGISREFGDAELARLMAPRKLETADGSTRALLQLLGLNEGALTTPPELSGNVDELVRMHRQFDQLVEYTQSLVRASDAKRTALWSGKQPREMRELIWNEVIGRLPEPSVPLNARTRQIYDEPKFRGYEVEMDVWPGVFASGILLVPKDLKPGERRPVVVCQHGLEGRSRDVADPAIDSPYYHRFAVQLAERGYVTFAPQNPYTGQDRFRQIQRKAHPLKLSLFSFILGQHQALLSWLGGLPFVDPARIGFYGLSYGGKTAVRVPPFLPQYALSICSADFNDWVRKTTSVDSKYSYMITGEYDMYEFDFANVTNYSDLAGLMAPRPFMVERGHGDGVAPDDWVASEYDRVRQFYAKQGIPERTEIEFFNGPHTINGKGTFEFLDRFLRP